MKEVPLSSLDVATESNCELAVSTPLTPLSSSASSLDVATVNDYELSVCTPLTPLSPSDRVVPIKAEEENRLLAKDCVAQIILKSFEGSNEQTPTDVQNDNTIRTPSEHVDQDITVLTKECLRSVYTKAQESVSIINASRAIVQAAVKNAITAAEKTVQKSITPTEEQKSITAVPKYVRVCGMWVEV